MDIRIEKHFYENLTTMMKKRIDELKAHVTYVSMAKKRAKKEVEDEDYEPYK